MYTKLKKVVLSTNLLLRCLVLNLYIFTCQVLGLDYADCVKFLLQGGLVPWMTRILGMALPMRNDAAGSNVAARWRQSFVHLVKTVYHLVKDPCNEYNLQPYTLATGMVTPLMKFLDGTLFEFVGICVWCLYAVRGSHRMVD